MAVTRCAGCHTIFYATQVGQMSDDRVGLFRGDGIIVPGRKSTFSRHLIEVPDPIINKRSLTPGNICDPCIQEVVNDGAKIL